MKKMCDEFKQRRESSSVYKIKRARKNYDQEKLVEKEGTRRLLICYWTVTSFVYSLYIIYYMYIYIYIYISLYHIYIFIFIYIYIFIFIIYIYIYIYISLYFHDFCVFQVYTGLVIFWGIFKGIFMTYNFDQST